MNRLLTAHHYGGIFLSQQSACNEPYQCLVDVALYKLSLNMSFYAENQLLFSFFDSHPVNSSQMKQQTFKHPFFVTTSHHPFFLWLLEKYMHIYQEWISNDSYNILNISGHQKAKMLDMNQLVCNSTTDFVLLKKQIQQYEIYRQRRHPLFSNDAMSEDSIRQMNHKQATMNSHNNINRNYSITDTVIFNDHNNGNISSKHLSNNESYYSGKQNYYRSSENNISVMTDKGEKTHRNIGNDYNDSIAELTTLSYNENDKEDVIILLSEADLLTLHHECSSADLAVASSKEIRKDGDTNHNREDSNTFVENLMSNNSNSNNSNNSKLNNSLLANSNMNHNSSDSSNNAKPIFQYSADDGKSSKKTATLHAF